MEIIEKKNKREILPLCQTDRYDNKLVVLELSISGGKASKSKTVHYLPGGIMKNFVTFSNFLLKLQLFISLTTIPSSFCSFLAEICREHKYTKQRYRHEPSPNMLANQ